MYFRPSTISACSSVDRAPASGAGCVGSIPIRRTIKSRLILKVKRLFIFITAACTARNREEKIRIAWNKVAR